MYSRYLLASSFALVLATVGAGCSSDKPPEEPAGKAGANPPQVSASPDQISGKAADTTGSDTLPAGDLLIEISASGVVIMARDVSRGTILSELARREGFELVTAEIAWEDVNQTIQAVNLHTALVEVLKPLPYQIIYEYDQDLGSDTLKRVVVGHAVALRQLPPTTAAGETAARPDIADLRLLPGAADTSLSAEDSALLNQLLDPSADVRLEAVEDISEPKGIMLDYLSTLVTTDPSPEVRMAAAYALEDSKDPRAMDALIVALQDADTEVLVEVIDAIENQENRGAIPYLMPLLEHPDEDVRESAEDALESLNQ